jgi:hypothetical protein
MGPTSNQWNWEMELGVAVIGTPPRRSTRPWSPALPPQRVEGDHIVTTTSAKPPSRDLASPSAPPSLLGSDDFRILRAWIRAEMAGAAPACERPIPTPTSHDPGRTERCEACTACRRHHETIVAAVATAVEECRARRVGRGTITDVYEAVPEPLRPFFGLPAGQGLKRLLGRWGKAGQFVPGDVPERWRLTEAEATLYWWSIRGWQEWEMQRELTLPKHLREDRARWVDIEEAVRKPLASAQRKVLGLFGLDDE